MKTFIAWAAIQLVVSGLLYGAEWFILLKVEAAPFILLNIVLSTVSSAYWRTQFENEHGVLYRIRAIMTVPACIYIIPFTAGTLGVLFSSSYREELARSLWYPFFIIPVWAICAYLVHWLRFRKS